MTHHECMLGVLDWVKGEMKSSTNTTPLCFLSAYTTSWHAHMHTCAYTHAHAHTCAYPHAHMYTHVHTHTHSPATMIPLLQWTVFSNFEPKSTFPSPHHFHQVFCFRDEKSSRQRVALALQMCPLHQWQQPEPSSQLVCACCLDLHSLLISSVHPPAFKGVDVLSLPRILTQTWGGGWGGQ